MNIIFETGFWSLNHDSLEIDLREISSAAENAFNEERIPFSRIRAWLSSFRLSLYVEGVPACQSDFFTEIKGPKAKFAYDINHNLTPAARGFALSQNCDPSALVSREIDGEKYLVARKTVKGRSVAELLAKIFPVVLSQISWKRKPWAQNMILPQPPAYITAVFGSEIIPLTIDEVRSGREIFIRNRRELKKVSLESADDFLKNISDEGFPAEPKDRQKIFESKMQSLVDKNHLLEKNTDSFRNIGFYYERPSFFSFKLPEDKCCCVAAICPGEFPKMVYLETNKGKQISDSIVPFEGTDPSEKELAARAFLLQKRYECLSETINRSFISNRAHYSEKLKVLPSALLNGSLFDEKTDLENILERIAGRTSLLFGQVKELSDFVEAYFFLKAFPESECILKNPDLKIYLFEKYDFLKILSDNILNCFTFSENTVFTGLTDREHFLIMGIMLQRLFFVSSRKKRERYAEALFDLFFEKTLPGDFLPFFEQSSEHFDELELWMSIFFKKLALKSEILNQSVSFRKIRNSNAIQLLNFFSRRSDFQSKYYPFIRDLTKNINSHLAPVTEISPETSDHTAKITEVTDASDFDRVTFLLSLEKEIEKDDGEIISVLDWLIFNKARITALLAEKETDSKILLKVLDLLCKFNL
ncbi:MAG: glycine--tRNA ligase subunit beta [Candidatus Riflebacteria bacterium]|nr:glycine--tRNA ligase subunit beta [Candidatus Riflebacteria bacterium]